MRSCRPAVPGAEGPAGEAAVGVCSLVQCRFCVVSVLPQRGGQCAREAGCELGWRVRGGTGGVGTCAGLPCALPLHGRVRPCARVTKPLSCPFSAGRRSTAPWTRAPRPRAGRRSPTATRSWACTTPKMTFLSERQVGAGAAAGGEGVPHGEGNLYGDEAHCVLGGLSGAHLRLTSAVPSQTRRISVLDTSRAPRALALSPAVMV